MSFHLDELTKFLKEKAETHQFIRHLVPLPLHVTTSTLQPTLAICSSPANPFQYPVLSKTEVIATGSNGFDDLGSKNFVALILRKIKF